MSPDKWKEIKGQLLDQFKDAELITEKLEEPEKGEKETLTFKGPLGLMKLEFWIKPIVIDKVTHGSRRIGSFTDVEYVYSETEFSHTLKAFKWDESQDDWVEIDLKQSFNI